MGWSCRADAMETMKRWDARCRADTGSANVYRHDGCLYILEMSRREHLDGAITGTVLRMINRDGSPQTDPRAEGFAVKVGSFRINGDGTIKRAPKGIK